MFAGRRLFALLALVLPIAIGEHVHVEDHPLVWLAALRNSTSTSKVTGGESRRVRFDAGAAPVEITRWEADQLELTDMRYVDVTEFDLEAADVTAQAFVLPSEPRFQTEVNAMIATLSQENLVTDLAALMSYSNRYYRGVNGQQASIDLVTKLSDIAAAAPGTGGAITITPFNHTWVQSSVIAHIAGTNETAPLVIVGAHLDTLNIANAKGADDDGSGSTNLIEVFRKLTAGGFQPTNPVEFHWYAGEEAGLLGSNAIAANYTRAGKTVLGMMQLDMTAYVKPGTTEVIGFITDFTNVALTDFARQLVTTYLSIPYSGSRCGYGCSDHASWNSAGFASVFPFESLFADDNSANIHSVRDLTTVNGFSFSHMHEYSKLATAFVMELAL